jgi:hypothetical protein
MVANVQDISAYSGPYYYQSKIAQQTTDIVLDCKSPFLEYLSSSEERPSILACKRLDVHGSE